MNLYDLSHQYIEALNSISDLDIPEDAIKDTLEALDDILCQDAGATILNDLKQTAFFEHLAGEVLAQIHPIEVDDKSKLEALRVLTALAKRELDCERDLALEGLVVVTLRNATVPTKVGDFQIQGSRGTWPVRLVLCGIPAL